MSSDAMDMDWLDKTSLKSVAARRFAEFCKRDMLTYDDPDDPEKDLYREAASLVLKRIEQAVSGGSDGEQA